MKTATTTTVAARGATGGRRRSNRGSAEDHLSFEVVDETEYDVTHPRLSDPLRLTHFGKFVVTMHHCEGTHVIPLFFRVQDGERRPYLSSTAMVGLFMNYLYEGGPGCKDSWRVFRESVSRRDDCLQVGGFLGTMLIMPFDATMRFLQRRTLEVGEADHDLRECFGRLLSAMRERCPDAMHPSEDPTPPLRRSDPRVRFSRLLSSTRERCRDAMHPSDEPTPSPNLDLAPTPAATIFDLPEEAVEAFTNEHAIETRFYADIQDRIKLDEVVVNDCTAILEEIGERKRTMEALLDDQGRREAECLAERDAAMQRVKRARTRRDAYERASERLERVRSLLFPPTLPRLLPPLPLHEPESVRLPTLPPPPP